MQTSTVKTQTEASASLLAQIKCNIEWDGRTLEDAEAISAAINGCALEAVTTDQAYAVLREIARTGKPVEDGPHDGYCITCERPSSLADAWIAGKVARKATGQSINQSSNDNRGRDRLTRKENHL